ncbi:hypothetical protein D555_0482 [Bordetella holmesii 35009]|nr:hypothetical protein D555_0482 [Bordetella holmesii 35009]
MAERHARLGISPETLAVRATLADAMAAFRQDLRLAFKRSPKTDDSAHVFSVL